MILERLTLKNFLSYRNTRIDFGALTVLVGQNASGKSNAVAAIKMLRDIPEFGLPSALARRGGFDQLRHRSHGRPYDPGIRLDFRVATDLEPSFYELSLGAVRGSRYEVKREACQIHSYEGSYTFDQNRGRFSAAQPKWDSDGDSPLIMEVAVPEDFRIPAGHSAITSGGSYGAFLMRDVLSSLGTVEINPSRVAELQDPASTDVFEPDGSNVASVFEMLNAAQRREMINELTAIVPGIERIDPRHVSDKLTLVFYQASAGGPREFLAKQMSDGTLRAFSILLALVNPQRPSFLVIEEPEIAIHLGALRTLVDILRLHLDRGQIVITTHSADMIDNLELDQLRLVWNHDGASHIAPIAEHSKVPVRDGLISPGELLRADALDPAE